MTALVFVPDGVIPLALGRLAGADTSSPDWGVMRDGWLTIWGVDQAAADAALAAYDPATVPPDPAAVVAAGLAIVSTGTPTLSGTYAIDETAQGNIVAVVTGINAGQGLPGGDATFTYRDTFGDHGPFDAPSFVAFAKAVRDFVYALGNGTVPAQPVTIP